MTDLRKLARGRECEIRVPGRCNRDSSTVVLCHCRMSGMSGMSIKAPDWLGAFGCFNCHQIVDGQAGGWVEYPQWYRDLLLADGVMRTLSILIDEGVIVVGGKAPKPSKIVRRRA